MATATADSYTASSGGTIYAGLIEALPAWLVGHSLNQWVSISGSSGAGGAGVNYYSGWGLVDSGAYEGTVVVAAAGGHGVDDNRVVSINLTDDAPAWATLKASSVSFGSYPYNADGTPVARHTYHSTIWSPYLDRMMLVGARYTGPSAVDYQTVDGFSLSTNAWDAAATYANITAGYGGACRDGSGNIWSVFGTHKYTVATNTWSAPVTLPANGGVRYPWAWDSSRSQFFGLAYGDGEGFGTPGMRAFKFSPGDSTQTAITFNASAAYTQWLADAPNYCGMDYDVPNDRFLFYDGKGAGAGRVYAITPNGGTAWDMSTLTMSGTSPTASYAASGVFSKFRYVAALQGFVLLGAAADTVRFFRTF